MLKEEPDSKVLLRSLAKVYLKLENADKCKEVDISGFFFFNILYVCC